MQTFSKDTHIYIDVYIYMCIHTQTPTPHPLVVGICGENTVYLADEDCHVK